MEDANSRIVLLGADHKGNSSRFGLDDEAIRLSEVYEYAFRLGNSQFSIPMLLPYRLAYARKLADFGLLRRAEKYVKAIYVTIGEIAQSARRDRVVRKKKKKKKKKLLILKILIIFLKR